MALLGLHHPAQGQNLSDEARTLSQHKATHVSIQLCHLPAEEEEEEDYKLPRPYDDPLDGGGSGGKSFSGTSSDLAPATAGSMMLPKHTYSHTKSCPLLPVQPRAQISRPQMQRRPALSRALCLAAKQRRFSQLQATATQEAPQASSAAQQVSSFKMGLHCQLINASL